MQHYSLFLSLILSLSPFFSNFIYPWNRSEINCRYFTIHVWKVTNVIQRIFALKLKTIFSLIRFKRGGHVIRLKVTSNIIPTIILLTYEEIAYDGTVLYFKCNEKNCVGLHRFWKNSFCIVPKATNYITSKS